MIYCDTGVENVLLDVYAKNTLHRMSDEFLAKFPEITVKLLKAPVSNRFFVKIIGRGYPPPTNSFRWCTKNLRIRPVAAHIAASAANDPIVVLGLRGSESNQRDRSLRQQLPGHWQVQRENSFKYRIFLPVIEFDLAGVWDAAFILENPQSIDINALEKLYRGATGECPTIKSPISPPCASGRFGCWTCTVVRKDKSAMSLVEQGYDELIPFLEFRNWLSTYRDDHSVRWPSRRNGSSGAGPFRVSARKEILSRLNKLEMETSIKVVESDEIEEIHRLWALDADNEYEQDDRPPPNLIQSTTAPS